MRTATRLSGKLDPRHASSSVLAVKPVLVGLPLDCLSGTLTISLKCQGMRAAASVR
jgi:hypothetical protein